MLTAKLILERFGRDGRLLEKREQPSRSFLLNFIGLLYVAHAQVTGGAPYSMNDITSAARNIDSQSTGRYVKGNLKIGSAPGNSQQLVVGNPYGSAPYNINPTVMMSGEMLGIVVGTGVGAVAPTDVALGTRILHGTQAGRFEYGGCELINIAFAAPNGSFDIRRYFTNHSGGAITVEEVGIYAAGTMFVNSACGSSWQFGVARDLTGGVAVADTELLRVTYTVQITV